MVVELYHMKVVEHHENQKSLRKAVLKKFAKVTVKHLRVNLFVKHLLWGPLESAAFIEIL